jgi:hypothetical protein
MSIGAAPRSVRKRASSGPLITLHQE